MAYNVAVVVGLSVVLLVYLLFLVVYLYLIWNRRYWKKRGVPYAEPVTLFGTFPSIVTRSRNFIFDMQDVYRKYRTKYRAIGIFMTRNPEILLLDPKLCHDILVANFSSFHDTVSSSWVNNRKADKYVSRNPFWCAGEEWKNFRTDLVSGLTQSKLRQSLPIWRSSYLKLRDFLDAKTKIQDELDAKDVAYRYTADVMSDFIWGIDAGTFTNPQEPNTIVQITSKWTTAAFNMLGYCFLLTIAPFVRYLYPFRFNPTDTDQFFSKLTRDAIKMRQQTEHAEQRTDFLNHLLMLEAKKAISHDDMVGHSLSILMDGYETTGSAVLHALLHLSKNSSVQDKLFKEIREVCRGEESLSYETIANMAYLDQCVHETLRLVSLIPSFSRICTKSLKIAIDEETSVEVEKGMVVTVPMYCIHHDELYYPEPTSYNPERFANAAHLDLIKKGLLLPFGDGPRICAGHKIAMLTIKTAVIEIVRKFELKPGTSKNKGTSTTSFVLILDGDAMLQFKKRNDSI